MGTPERKPGPKQGGRPAIYKPEFIAQAKKLCAAGLTEYEVADFFGVSVPTIWRWKAQFPKFCNAMVTGKSKADERVVGSTYHKAVGYTFKSEKVFQYQGEIIRAETIEHVPPDMVAASLWLRNRQPDKWRDRSGDQNININVTLADLVNLSFKADLPELPAPKVIENEGDS